MRASEKSRTVLRACLIVVSSEREELGTRRTGNSCVWRKQGQEGAFEQLVRRHQHHVFNLVGAMLRRQNEDVEDVAQQVFLKDLSQHSEV